MPRTVSIEGNSQDRTIRGKRQEPDDSCFVKARPPTRRELEKYNAIAQQQPLIGDAKKRQAQPARASPGLQQDQASSDAQPAHPHPEP